MSRPECQILTPGWSDGGVVYGDELRRKLHETVRRRGASQHMGGTNLIEKNIAMEKGNLASGEPHGRRLDVRPAGEAL